MSDKLVNIITCDNMKADAVLLANGKITAMEFSQMHKKIEKLEASNKELREIICEYGLNIADQDYLLRPDTISRTIDIMVEEKGKDGWYGNKLKENQKARGLK